MSAAVIIASVGLFFPFNAFYEGWHDKNYVRKDEIIVVVRRVDVHEAMLGEVRTQLSSIRVQGAVSVASALQSELDKLEAKPESTVEYRLRVATIRNRVQQAVQYRDCLWESRHNCEAIRGY